MHIQTYICVFRWLFKKLVCQNAHEKILKEYKGRINVIKGKTVRGNILHSSELTAEEAFKIAERRNMQSRICETALQLRANILESETNPIPENLTFEDVVKGEVQIPEVLPTFITYLVAGPAMRNVESTVKACRIKSICSDIIFAATSGRKKPSKHLQLGITMKSLTGSKKVVQILNRLGHTASYDTVEEM